MGGAYFGRIQRHGMCVDFHSVQKIGLSVFLPLQLLHLSIEADIFSPEDATVSKLV